MTIANYSDRDPIVKILCDSFKENRSVDYILKKSNTKALQIQKLMEYSFDMCFHFGKVILSEDKKGCALIVLPEKKKVNIKSILLDLNLAVSVIGLFNLGKIMRRESTIKKLHPKKPTYYYLWFIGVDPTHQGKGIGTKLLNEIIEEARSGNKSIYLETSVPKNIPWYEKFGFNVYDKLDFGYELFCLKNECT